jgi:hypothetical protein
LITIEISIIATHTEDAGEFQDHIMEDMAGDGTEDMEDTAEIISKKNYD